MSPSLPHTRTIVRVALTVGAFVGLCYLAYLIRDVVALVGLAALLAIALGPYVEFFERRRVPRPAAVLLVYVLLLLAIIGVGLLVVPPLVEQVEELAADIPGYIDELSRNKTFQEYDREYGVTESLRQQASELPSQLGTAAETLQDITVGVFAAITQLLIVLTMTFLMLLNRDRMVGWVVQRLGPRRGPRARRLGDDMYRAMSGFVIGNVVVSLIAGIVTYVTLTILGVPFAVPLAILMGFLDVIPVVGATIGGIIVGLVTLFVDFPTATIVWVASQVIYQQVETQWIRPLVYQRAIDMYPLVGIVSVLFGAELLGVLGAIIAVPVAAALQILGRDWWRARSDTARHDAAVASVSEGGVRGTAPSAKPGPQPAG